MRCMCSFCLSAHWFPDAGFAAAKRNTINMHDTSASMFEPKPEGPFENEAISDQAAAQAHFNSTREIKLKDPKGRDLPQTSYV
jgi:hypothetical protein